MATKNKELEAVNAKAAKAVEDAQEKAKKQIEQKHEETDKKIQEVLQKAATAPAVPTPVQSTQIETIKTELKNLTDTVATVVKGRAEDVTKAKDLATETKALKDQVEACGKK